MLTNNGKQRIEGVRISDEELVKPWLTQEQRSTLHVGGCRNGWVAVYDYGYQRQEKFDERTQYEVEIEVAPDVESGLLVRTTEWKLNATGLWNTSYRTHQSTQYARLAPAAWPTRWVPNADNLPELKGREERDNRNRAINYPVLLKERRAETMKTDAVHTEPSQLRSSVPQPLARTPPAITVAQLARIQDRIRMSLKSTTTMESFALDGDIITFGGRVANLQDFRALIEVLRADHDIVEVRIAEISTGEHDTSNFKLTLTIKTTVRKIRARQARGWSNTDRVESGNTTFLPSLASLLLICLKPWHEQTTLPTTVEVLELSNSALTFRTSGRAGSGVPDLPSVAARRPPKH